MISMIHSPIASSQSNNNEKKMPEEKKSKKSAKPELILLDDDEDNVEQNRYDYNNYYKENKNIGKKSTIIIENDSILKSYHQPKKLEAASIKVTPFTKKQTSSSPSRNSGSVITSTSTITSHIDSQEESPDVTPSKNIKNLIESPILNKGLNRLIKKSGFTSSQNNNEDDAPEIITNVEIPESEIPKSNSVIKENPCTTDKQAGSAIKSFSNLSSYSGSPRTIKMLNAAAKLASSNGSNHPKSVPLKSKNKSSSPLTRGSIIRSPTISRGAAFLKALGKHMENSDKIESTSKSQEVSSANNSTSVITSNEKILNNASSTHTLPSVSNGGKQSLGSVLDDESIDNSGKKKHDQDGNDEPLISNSESMDVDAEQTPPRKFKRTKLDLYGEENGQCSQRPKIIRLDSEIINDENPKLKINSRQTSKSNRNLFDNDMTEENLEDSSYNGNDAITPEESELNTNNQEINSKVSVENKDTVYDSEDQEEADGYRSDNSSDLELVFSSISTKYQSGDDPNCSVYIKDVSNKQIEDVSKDWVQCVEFVQSSSSDDDCINVPKKKKQKSKFSVKDVSQSIIDSDDSSDDNGVEVLPVIDHPSSPDQSQQKGTKIIDLAEISVDDDDDEDYGINNRSKNGGKMPENVNVRLDYSLKENDNQSDEIKFVSPGMFDNFEPFPKSQTPVCRQKFKQSDDGSGLIIHDVDSDSPLIVSPIGVGIEDDENLDDTITLFSECSSGITVSDNQKDDATSLTTSIDIVDKPILSSQESTEQLIELSDRSDNSPTLDSCHDDFKAKTKPNKSILRPPSFEVNGSSKKKRVIFSEPVVSCELVFDNSAPTPENPEIDLTFNWLPAGIKEFDLSWNQNSDEMQQKTTTIESKIGSSFKKMHEDRGGPSSSLTQKRRKLCHQNATLDDHDHYVGSEETKKDDVSDWAECSTHKTSNGTMNHKLLSLIETSEDEDDVYFSLSQVGNQNVFDFVPNNDPDQNLESNAGEKLVSNTTKISPTKDCSTTENDHDKQSIDAEKLSYVSNIDETSNQSPATISSSDSIFQVYTQNQFQKPESNDQEETIRMGDMLGDVFHDNLYDVEKDHESSEQNRKISEEPEMLTMQIPLKLAKEFHHYLGKYIQSYESSKGRKS